MATSIAEFQRTLTELKSRLGLENNNKSPFNAEETKRLLDRAKVQFDFLRLDKMLTRKAITEYREELKVLKNEYEWRMTSVNKAELLDGHKAEATPTTANDLMVHGEKVQKESLQSLKGAILTIYEAKDIGAETQRKLEEDNDRIVDIHDKVVGIDANLDRVQTSIVRMLRRLATDKVIWVFIVLILVAIILIVLAHYHKLGN